MGLLTGVISLAREPARLTLRAWELGLSSAATAARLGLELLDPGRSSPTVAGERWSPPPSPPGNGGPPDVERGGAAEPDVVVPETGYLAPEPGEVGPEPDVLDVDDAAAPASGASAADAPPSIPDALIPDHIDEEPVLVAETAEAGAEDGAGPELHIDAPWDGYDGMTAADIRGRLQAATPAEAAAVELYEASRKGRSSVLQAAGRALKR